MKCNHCGADVPDNSKFCNVCGEPLDNPIEIEKRESYRAKWSFIWEQSKIIWLGFILVGFSIGAVVALFFAAQDKAIIKSTVIWIGLIGGLIYVVISYVSLLFRPKKQKIIDSQFYRDKTSICPVCGSHSVKVYRKGYDWQEAFWGNLFKIRGSRYTAGFDSNDAMCFCKHCGHKWNTHYDIRTIK